ncbi:chitinase [Geosmithia morbida]|uniref:chitinase n=1 Tax=Geosmithia morbida TaxID=1094350 RepID=A0A9P5D3I6_9HYPO|nr:chitinase [Geosmithia morbida]KAF4126228.1 chitinase [Geosmithia morbida]
MLDFLKKNSHKADSGSGHHTQQGYRTVAYFVNWAVYGRKHTPQDLPVEKLTHVLYSFANVRPDSGEVYMTDDWSDTGIHYEGDSWNDTGNNMYGSLKQLNLLKRRNRNLKVLLSIGGWTYSANFKAPASTSQGRTAFAKSAVALLEKFGFDGIDIDWEYPQNPSEASDFVSLLEAVRAELDAAGQGRGGHHFELTVACPAGSSNYTNMDIRGMDRYLDFWNLMAYDFAGSWDQVSAHQANLYPNQKQPAATPFSITGAVDYYLGQGIRPDKMVIGMPLYGRAFENTDGIGTPFQGIGEGTWEQGVHDYKKLPLPGFREVHDKDAGASYCFSAEQRKLVTYDTPAMASVKTEYIREKGLGGAMWWESSADKQGDESLITIVVNGFGGPGGLLKQDNCIEYPNSSYDNLRNGFPGN